MVVSRRSLLFPIDSFRSARNPAWISARGREALVGEFGEHASWMAAAEADEANPIVLNSNENPLGPSPAAIEAILGEFDQANRYPFNSRKSDDALSALIAARYSVKPENVVLGAGSAEILRNAARAFTSGTRPLVTAAPTFANCENVTKKLGNPVKSIQVDKNLMLDLEGMAAAASNAGLMFLCNPNNPTGTLHPAETIRDFVIGVRKANPDCAILIDEAYNDYVTDPRYRSAVDLAMEHKGVFILRTLSKTHGMAGLRIGYAVGQTDTIGMLNRWKMPYNANVPVIAAAMASINDQATLDRERERNTVVRQFTTDYFTKAGFKVADSQTNFVFVDLQRPARAFREACAAQGVLVGRDFPPLNQSWSRVSIGTMEEMQRATEVFTKVLAATPTSASRA